MNYLKELTKEEIEYICRTIPFNVASGYFRRYPKEFTKIRPGFRVKSLTEDMVARTLYDFRTRDFIETFIIEVVNQWIKEIDEELDKTIQEGITQEAAYIEVLSQSFFAENVPLYFKIKEEKSEEYLHIMSDAVLYQAQKNKYNRDEISQLKKREAEIDKRVEDLNDKFSEEKKKADRLRKNAIDLKTAFEEKSTIVESEKQKNADLIRDISALEKKLVKAEADSAKKDKEFVEKTSHLIRQSESYEKQIEELKKLLDDANSVINEYRMNIASSKDGSDALKAINGDLEAQIATFRTRISELEEVVSALTIEKSASDGIIQYLREENAAINIHNEELQQTIRKLEEAVENVVQNTPVSDTSVCIETKKSVLYTKPLCPVDMDDFDEYFLYNFTNIGFREADDGGSDLIDYVKQTVFKGVPLLIRRGPGINLANCLANTIYGQNNARIIFYKNGMTISDLESMLDSSSDRIVCLDGFVGNWNEIELLPVLNQYRNKIIILTYMYDKTLRYIPVGILSEVCFISMDRFNALMKIKDITEDPSEIMEKEFAIQETCTDNRSRKIFMEIAQECGIDMGTASSMSDSIEDEASMNRILLFTLLPYLVSVIGVKPYNRSKRLQKYAGESGRCTNKETMMRWFG